LSQIAVDVIPASMQRIALMSSVGSTNRGFQSSKLPTDGSFVLCTRHLSIVAARFSVIFFGRARFSNYSA
jgi:hypothetical protein